MRPVLFDSNILVYAHNLDSPFYNKATDLHRKVISGELNAAVAVQNLLEFYSVITDPKRIAKAKNPGIARKYCLAYLKAGFKIIYPQAGDFEKMLGLGSKKQIKSQKIFDVYLVATMLSNGIRTIYTANERDFEMFGEIRAVNPVT